MRLLAWSLLLIVTGCSGGDSDGMTDGSAGDGGPDEGPVVAPPELPTPPMLGPCPDGFREETSEDSVTVCEPWPGDAPDNCPDVDEAHFPGEPGCARLGPACPASGLPEGLPADRPVIYASAGASAGDGTSSAPFGTLREALTSLTSGAVLAVGIGSYEEVLSLSAGVEVIGACVAETTIASADPNTIAGVINPRGPGVVVRSLRVGPSERSAAFIDEGRELTFVDVVIDRARGAAITLRGGRLVADGLVIRDTQPRISDGRMGYGIEAGAGGVVEVARGFFSEGKEVGVIAHDAGSSVSLTRSAIWDTRGMPSTGAVGFGLVAFLGAEATLVESVVQRSRDVGINVFGPGSHLRLEDSIVRQTQSRAADRAQGFGIFANEEGVAEILRSSLDENRMIGFFADGAGDLRLEDVVIRDTQPEEASGMFGRALTIQFGPAQVTRAVLERNHNVGAFFGGEGATVSVEDLIVRDGLPQPSDLWDGRGVSIQDGSVTTMRRALFERNRGVGVFVAGAGAEATIEDLTVRDTESREADGGAGTGVSIQEEAVVTVRRALIERATESGLFLHGAGVRVRVEDARIVDTRSRADGVAGRGVSVQDGPSVELERVRIERNRDVGLFVIGAGATASLRDTAVLDTAPAACASTTCAGRAAGTGVVSAEGASVDASGFEVRRSALCGAQVIDDSTLHLASGWVTGNAIGVCIQTPDFDYAQVMDEVRYSDNGVNLEATTLPLPEPTLPNTSI